MLVCAAVCAMCPPMHRANWPIVMRRRRSQHDETCTRDAAPVPQCEDAIAEAKCKCRILLTVAAAVARSIGFICASTHSVRLHVRHWRSHGAFLGTATQTSSIALHHVHPQHVKRMSYVPGQRTRSHTTRGSPAHNCTHIRIAMPCRARARVYVCVCV